MKFFRYIFFILLCIPLFANEWVYDFEEAKKIALEDDKLIVLVFQGSDWCSPCIKLDREIWNNNEFKKIASENFVMLLADFPRKKSNALSQIQKEKNYLLAEKYNPNGFFPFVIIFNSYGEVIGQTGYEKISPQEYANKILKFKI
jgi:thioredoxin-related protein